MGYITSAPCTEANERIARVAALELLHDQPVAHIVESRAAVFLGKIRAEHAEFGHRRDELFRKSTLHVALADDRKHLFVDKPADGIAHRALIFRECGVDVEEIALARLQLGRGKMGFAVDMCEDVRERL